MVQFAALRPQSLASAEKLMWTREPALKQPAARPHELRQEATPAVMTQELGSLVEESSQLKPEPTAAGPTAVRAPAREPSQARQPDRGLTLAAEAIPAFWCRPP